MRDGILVLIAFAFFVIAVVAAAISRDVGLPAIGWVGAGLAALALTGADWPTRRPPAQ